MSIHFCKGILWQVLLISLGLTAISCAYDSPFPLSEKIADGYPTGPGAATADQLRYAQDYKAAALAYQEALTQPQLSTEDSIYLLEQSIYCYLQMNNTEATTENITTVDRLLARILSPERPLLGDHFYNKGRYHFLHQQPDTALKYAHRALAYYNRYYPPGHLKIAQTYTLLSLIHLKDGHLTDSIHYYALQANNFFLNNPELSDYDWENDYIQGYTSLYNRAHEIGEYHCRAALQQIRELPFDNPWLEARTMNLLGRMLKKRADWLIGEDPLLLKERKMNLYRSADSLFQLAIDIGTKHNDPELLVFYNDWIINVHRFSDPDYFRRSLRALEEQFSGSAQEWRPYYDRLSAYYAFFSGNIEAAIRHYTDFLQAKEQDPHEDYTLIAEAYYVLRVANNSLQNFDRAADYAKRSFKLYGCLTEEVDITSPEAIASLDSTRRYCLITSGFFAESLLRKYQAQQRPQDLQLANDYFDFVERHSFKSLLNADEDAFLTFQFEAGSRIFADAIEAANEAWNVSQDVHWLNKAFNYSEYLKSYLLYRDMLKASAGSDEGYSLTDSIRILQGQVNQMLFRLDVENKEESEALYENDLIRRLKSLEYRRVAKLDSLETVGFRSQTDVASIRSHLADRQGLVNYYSSNRNLYGIYIDSDTVAFFHLTDGYPAVRKAIADYRNSIEKEVKMDGNTIDQYLSSAHTLYDALIQPFAGRLSDIDQLLIIPDQLLDPVPFEALLSEEVVAGDFSFKDLPYLLHQVQIFYTSSWKVYRANQDKIASDYRNSQIGFWTTPELSSNNGLEVIEAAIDESFGREYEVFNRRNGGKQLFSNNHHRFDILHLLLHASSSRTNRYDNRIRFGEDAEDVIYGFELYKQKFTADLLVLASCESAAGTPQTGEGTFSLARSFINSGIPEIIAAQFLIPQTTTGPLLAHFYHYLGEGHPAAEALHLAKLEYLRSIPKERYAYPRFWAGMVAFN